MLRLLAPLLLLSSSVLPQHPSRTEEDYNPEVAGASDEGAVEMANIKLPEGFVCELVAAEPHLANPVCFWPAVDGSFYVAETFRLHAGVTDMREHVERLEEDMACQTVEDRVAMHKRWAGDSFKQDYGKEHERVRLLRDLDGDGVVDQSTTFADGFKDPAAGIAAGILEHDGAVYYTCIPDLWKLEDNDGDDVADTRVSLSTGYGVRVTLLGHDLHGLQIGPDGWLYFSCGDRGFNVKTPEGRIVHPDTGAVLRCRLDGSDLEVVHTGLRNPQELAFDAYGNLFTGDNNSDGGDKARWVLILEGADTGWRSSYQWIFEPESRGPWNEESLWKPHFEGQAAYISPAIDNIAAGPSGLAYYPGTGSGNGLDGTFLLCDFRGYRGGSGVHAFTLEPDGANFKLTNRQEYIWNTLVTDVDFGPDGSIYFSDWVTGWGMTGKGRIYRAYDPSVRDTDAVREVNALLRGGAKDLDQDRLEMLLKHQDMRVRRLAQFELVARGPGGWDRMQQVLKNASDPMASLHSVWGLGMAAETEPSLLEYLNPFLRDPNPRVRAQTARVLGDHRYEPATSQLIAAVADLDPTVRRFASIACGRLGDDRAVEALVELAVQDAATDTVLRHGASWGLSQCASAEQLVALKEHNSVHVRLAAVVALRLQKSAHVAAFLTDADPLVVVEAARAISDVPIAAAYGELAALASDETIQDDQVVRRVLNANLRMGEAANVEALAAMALSDKRSDRVRADAVQVLGTWKTPSPRHYILSNWAPLEERDPALANQRLAEFAKGSILDAPDPVLLAWIGAIDELGFDGKQAALQAILRNTALASDTRVAAFEGLRTAESADLGQLVGTALQDHDTHLRAAALELLPGLDPAQAIPLFAEVLENGDVVECRAVYKALSAMEIFEAQELLTKEFEKLRKTSLRRELQLDLVEAMYQMESNATRQQVDRLRSVRRERDPVAAKWLDTLWGGDKEAGKKIFEQDVALSCMRCHLSGEGASVSVGPDLTGVGERLSRRQILESIITPNAMIAEGYESLLFVLEEDELVAGRVIEQTETLVRIVESSGEIREIDPKTIVERRQDLSAMPSGMDLLLKPRAMRDLIEYVASL